MNVKTKDLLRNALPLIAVAAATFLFFLPVLDNGFIADWDDGGKLLRNPHYRGFALENLRWMFTTAWGHHYHPLTWLSFAADHALWGMNPRGYHFTSLLLHAGAAAVFFLLCRRLLALGGLKDDRAAAAFAALAFAVHPLRVESVAWATERSDVLSGLFYLLTVLFYLEARARPRKAVFTAGALVCYLLSLLSKAIGITLPLTLLIIDVFPLKRLPGDPRRWLKGANARVLAEKLPFAAVAAAAAGTAYCVQSNLMWFAGRHSWSGGLAKAFYGAAFYPLKTLLPVGLLPLYPPPERLSLTGYPIPAAAAAVLGLTFFFWSQRKKRPALPAAWAFYLITLAPVIGLINAGPQLAADRYSYLSCLPWAVLAGAAFARLRTTAYRLPAALGAACLIALLGTLTSSQARLWRDAQTLWSATVRRSPGHHIALDRMGRIRARQGKPEEARRFYEEALAIRPSFGAAHNDLGNLLVNTGRVDEGIAHLRQALRSDPEREAVHFNLGIALLKKGRLEEAAPHFREELKINPRHAASQSALREIARSKRPEID